MPTVQEPVPIAVVISDLHLTLTQPACRADKDWMAVQAHYLEQVREIAGDLPVLCAGDIFDRWNAPNELVNFALKHLPENLLSVPGQHDLPNHRIDQMHRCGYGVLVNARRMRDAANQDIGPFRFKNSPMVIYGCGWGQNIPVISPDWEKDPIGKLFIKVALVHRYCWCETHHYPGAPDESNVSMLKKQLKGYDVAIFGDNHLGFLSSAGNCTVLNVGGFIRRRSDELDYVPRIGIIYSDGSVKRKKLDTSIDRFQEVPEGRDESPLNMKEFIEGLESLGEHGLNFREAVENHLRTDDIDKRVKEIILQCLTA